MFLGMGRYHQDFKIAAPYCALKYAHNSKPLTSGCFAEAFGAPLLPSRPTNQHSSKTTAGNRCPHSRNRREVIQLSDKPHPPLHI
jgi:hypothetical protein